MSISSKTPITTTAGLWWVTQLHASTKGIGARLEPSDGTYLVTSSAAVKRVFDASLAGVAQASAILAAAQLLAGQPVPAISVNVQSHDPAGKALLVAVFPAPAKRFVCPDLFAALAANAAAMSAYETVLSYLQTKV